MTLRELIQRLLECENLDEEAYAHMVWRDNPEYNCVVRDLNAPISFVRTLRNEIQIEMGYTEQVCARTACRIKLKGGYFRIWNEPRTDQPRVYCAKCGRKIIEANKNDTVKLKYEMVSEGKN